MPTNPTAITALPSPPDPANRATFNTLAYPWSVALGTYSTQINALGTVTYNNAVEAAASASTATTQAGNASASASTASGHATTATTQAGIATTKAAEAAASAAMASGAAAFVDSNPVVKGSVDATKQMRFEVDGLTTGTTRVLTVPDADMTLAGRGANTFTGAQILSDQQVSRAMLIDCGFTVVAKGNSGTSTQTYDYTAGSVQTSTATGNHTIAFSNFPPTGNLGAIQVLLTNGGAFTLTWPTVNWILPTGLTTTSISTYLAALTGRTALQSSGVDQFVFWTQDAGTTVYGKLI